MKACARCAERAGTHRMGVLDDGGASFVDVCGVCRGIIEAERCHVCGGTYDDEKTGDLGVVFETGDEMHGICRGCRRELLAIKKNDRREAEI